MPMLQGLQNFGAGQDTHGEDVDADALGAVPGGALDEADELVVAAVHAAVGQQPDEVQGVVRKSLRDVLPAVQLEGRAVLQRNVHQPRALVDHLARACGQHTATG